MDLNCASQCGSFTVGAVKRAPLNPPSLGLEHHWDWEIVFRQERFLSSLTHGIGPRNAHKPARLGFVLLERLLERANRTGLLRDKGVVHTSRQVPNCYMSFNVVVLLCDATRSSHELEVVSAKTAIVASKDIFGQFRELLVFRIAQSRPVRHAHACKLEGGISH